MGSRRRLCEDLEFIQGVHASDINKVADAVEALSSAGDKFTDLLFEWNTNSQANLDEVVDKLRLQLRGLSLHVDAIAVARLRSR